MFCFMANRIHINPALIDQAIYLELEFVNPRQLTNQTPWMLISFPSNADRVYVVRCDSNCVYFNV